MNTPTKVCSVTCLQNGGCRLWYKVLGVSYFHIFNLFHLFTCHSIQGATPFIPASNGEYFFTCYTDWDHNLKANSPTKCYAIPLAVLVWTAQKKQNNKNPFFPHPVPNLRHTLFVCRPSMRTEQHFLVASTVALHWEVTGSETWVMWHQEDFSSFISIT